MEAIFEAPWFAVVWTLVGIVLASAVAIQWGKNRGRQLGVLIGKTLPGDKVEQWLVEFLMGMKEGLESTYGNPTVETTTNWKSNTATELTVNVLKNPSSGRAS